MKKVGPIKERDKIEKMKEELLKMSTRNYILFMIGINTGLRIKQLLNLKVKDIKGKSFIDIEHMKNKINKIPINNELKKILNKYIKDMKKYEYLFQSEKGANKPIGRIQAYRILNKAGKKVGLKSIGTHTLRKTFGYFHYKKYKDIKLLQKFFNHPAPSFTFKYIGLIEKDQEIVDESIRNLKL